MYIIPQEKKQRGEETKWKKVKSSTEYLHTIMETLHLNLIVSA